ncbi:efflux RND transporter periplasmic adaptor subunit [Ensifer sp. ENS07]|uniref:Efflux RND transporter periplasmic adaptor subunit n=1 Tax=Ensifer adhaerens TaxID=106592 RepID=A0A9Q8Y5G1_ENSAD|nr:MULTISPECIES: efflux RND transporter periplasmic adaptor subunit [Ensifer]MBD9494765.1 efflux RND transporter periplasmic adaptor subunit [Ensifer sp. ENS01]MBD9521719.1 efflux RND transporter periplasmic adaptor subunit [Ensifer sp. ENS02]MBD9594789.1 efflux RND transporter periplasmic adaptor subunit [Ensifer sp. ENS05]MBD9638075.1 efflux RND transporter periplasmic adaptor subunit [Ensifer sp. ENS07]USJ22738.1 efflux RND transporter periplasmic adaptor subunit [Ensifer adhaerens]
MRRTVELNVALAALLVIAAAAGPARASGEAAASVPAPSATRTVTTLVADSRPQQWTRSFAGIFVAREEIAVGTTLTDQRIASVEVEIGDRVAAGQVLARLETDMLENLLREAKGRVARASAAMAREEETVTQEQRKLARARQLSHLQAATILEERVSALALAEQAVEVARADYDQAEALEAEARRRLDRAVIVAPADGIVSERLARAGALAGSDPLLKLIRGGEIEFAAEVPETELPLLAVGQTVKVKLSGRADWLQGHVRVINPKIDRETRLGTAQVTLSTERPPFAGTFGRAEIVVGERKAIMVDDSALLFGAPDGAVSVFVVDGGQVVRKSVKPGMRQGGKVEITSGLSTGERVVLKSGASLREGEAVATKDVQPTQTGDQQ